MLDGKWMNTLCPFNELRPCDWDCAALHSMGVFGDGAEYYDCGLVEGKSRKCFRVEDATYAPEGIGARAIRTQLVPVRLAEMRASKGITKTGLARITGVQASIIGQIESGRLIPYESQLSKIAAALGFEGDPAQLLEPIPEEAER